MIQNIPHSNSYPLFTTLPSWLDLGLLTGVTGDQHGWCWPVGMSSRRPLLVQMSSFILNLIICLIHGWFFFYLAEIQFRRYNKIIQFQNYDYERKLILQCCTTSGCNWNWSSASQNIGSGETTGNLTTAGSSSNTVILGLIGEYVPFIVLSSSSYSSSWFWRCSSVRTSHCFTVSSHLLRAHCPEEEARGRQML